MARLADLSLYIHIPFCVKRCRYCDFYSETGVARPLIAKTLDTLLASLDTALERWRPDHIPTVFIGGGTPSLVPPEMFRGFLEGLHRRIGTPQEFSIEVNPESLTGEFLAMLSGSNVNRISMGVQTYDEDLLKWLGRPAGPEAVTRADGLLAEFWKGRLSRDLLAGLPGRENRLLEDLRQALSDDPGHLSVYELTVEKGTPLADSSSDLKRLPDEETSAREWMSLLEEMRCRGYRRYEVSNFARPGEEALHNLRYWRLNPYLGIGPGAVSSLPPSTGKSAALRLENLPDLFRWLDNPSGSISATDLAAGELMLEHFMMALRTAEGLSRSNFRSIFQFDPLDAAPAALERWRKSGMVRIDEKSIAPTGAGMDFVDAVLADIAVEAERVIFPSDCLWPPP